MSEMGTTGPIEGFRFDGKTDPQIIRELMTAAGHRNATSDTHIEQVCRRYVELLEIELDSSEMRARLFDGVEQLIGEIERHGDSVVGLLTGNLARGAELKLQAAGLDPARFPVGAFGSDSADRSSLPQIAAERAGLLMGSVPRGDEIVIMGDTPADVTCGQTIGARAIGVATGSYSTEDLTAAGAFVAFENLADHSIVLQAIYS